MQKKVILLRQFFALAYSNDTHPYSHDYTYKNVTHISKLFNNVEDISETLIAFPKKFSFGLDGISPYIVPNCVYSFAKPLFILFHLSVKTEVFPDSSKQSYIVQILRFGNKQNISNYRGVCHQTAILKTFDKLVTEELSIACKGNKKSYSI